MAQNDMPRAEPETDALDDPERIRRDLLAHYDAHRRDLPWRQDPTPYATWISEVMLQQTRVETAAPYFHRWMERFPTVHSLAKADEEDVLRSWEGLGYYSRARNLHRAARLVRERHGGALPRSAVELRELPGVGEYTAGAVASIAFGEPVPAVDGNVRRVLSRLFDIERPTPARLRREANALVPEHRPGDFNQALMELGATICTPRSPSCNACPLGEHCLARSRGSVELRPPPRNRRPIPAFDIATTLVVDREGGLLLRRRPENGLLGGLWEFPGVDSTNAPSADAAARLASELLPKEPSLCGDPERLPAVSHVFSHRRETYHPWLFRVAGRIHCEEPCARVPIEDLAAHPMPRAQRRIQDRALGRLAHNVR